MSYVEKEDCLLFCATTRSGEEYRVWLTRRFTILLFDVLNRVMDKKGGVVSVDFSRETRQMFKSGALEKEFQAEKPPVPPERRESWPASSDPEAVRRTPFTWNCCRKQAPESR